MCEFCENSFKSAAMSVANQVSSPDQLASVVKQNFPFALRPFCCPSCGHFLPEMERMNPNAACTRSMCEADYHNVFAGNVSASCKVCGGTLDQAKYHAQMQNPREVRNHIHEGDCLSLWALIHNVAFGSPGFAERYRDQLKSEDYSSNEYHDDNAFDAEYNVVRPQPVRALPSPVLQIGYQPQQTMEQYFEGYGGRSDDENVKVMRVPRKGYSY